MPRARWGHFRVLRYVNAYDGAMITLGSERGLRGHAYFLVVLAGHGGRTNLGVDL